MKHKKMKKFSIRLVLNHKGLVIDFWRKIPIMPKKFTKQDFNFVEKKNLEDVGDIPLCRKKSYRMLLDMNYRCKRVGGHTPEEG